MNRLYRYISVNRKTYGYQVVGDGSPLVLLHGFTGTSHTWHEAIQSWKEHYQLVAIDLPGHGASRKATVHSMEEFCSDLNEILTYLEINRAHVLGYSLGGRTALSFAILYPERVTSLILESASPGLKTEKERLSRMEQDEKLAVMLETEGIEVFVRYWENIPLFQTQQHLPKHIQHKVRAERLSQSNIGLAMSLRSMGTARQSSWWEKLRSVNVPVLLITGELDEKFVRINREMKRLLQDVTFYVVEKSGHAVHIEQAEKFVKIVMDFVKENNEKRVR